MPALLLVAQLCHINKKLIRFNIRLHSQDTRVLNITASSIHYVRLELDQVRSVGFAQGESGTQISTQQMNLLNICLQNSIHSILSTLSLGGGHGSLGRFGIEQSILAFLSNGLLTREECIVNFGSVNTSDGHLGGCGNDVSLVHSAEGDAVDNVRACYKIININGCS